MKKVFILLPDGVGLRNFVFGNIQNVFKNFNISIHYWNNTKYRIKDKTGYNEIKIVNAKNHFLSDLVKKAKTDI